MTSFFKKAKELNEPTKGVIIFFALLAIFIPLFFLLKKDISVGIKSTERINIIKEEINKSKKKGLDVYKEAIENSKKEEKKVINKINQAVGTSTPTSTENTNKNGKNIIK